MPYPVIRERNNKCFANREPRLAYGNEFLKDTYPSEPPYPSAWGNRIILTPPQYTPVCRLKYSFCNTPNANEESLAESLVILSGYPEKKDPFTQVGLLDSEEEQIQELILRLRTSGSIPYRVNLANRLVNLLHDAKEEDPNSLGIAVGSLRNYINFLQLHTNLTFPIISLTPEYNIYSTWREENNRLFSVHFLTDGGVRFVIFKPNDRHPERKIRISGIATTDVLLATVAPYGVLDWISE